MNDLIQKQLQQYVGGFVEVKLKTGVEIYGKILWLSPDQNMVEIQCENGLIKTFIHGDTKAVATCTSI